MPEFPTKHEPNLGPSGLLKPSFAERRQRAAQRFMELSRIERRLLFVVRSIGLLSFSWIAIALSVIVLFAPMTSVFQALGGNEIVDVEQEECSVKIEESLREVRQRREVPGLRVAQTLPLSTSIKSRAHRRSRRSERDFLNGTGGWLRL